MSDTHFGHYIAGTFNPDILIGSATMTNIPLQTGYDPKCWHQHHLKHYDQENTWGTSGLSFFSKPS